MERTALPFLTFIEKCREGHPIIVLVLVVLVVLFVLFVLVVLVVSLLFLQTLCRQGRSEGRKTEGLMKKLHHIIQ